MTEAEVRKTGKSALISTMATKNVVRALLEQPITRLHPEFHGRNDCWASRELI
jgi:hypothetical protein